MKKQTIIEKMKALEQFHKEQAEKYGIKGIGIVTNKLTGTNSQCKPVYDAYLKILTAQKEGK